MIHEQPERTIPFEERCPKDAELSATAMLWASIVVGSYTDNLVHRYVVRMKEQLSETRSPLVVSQFILNLMRADSEAYTIVRSI